MPIASREFFKHCSVKVALTVPPVVLLSAGILYFAFDDLAYRVTNPAPVPAARPVDAYSRPSLSADSAAFTPD